MAELRRYVQQALVLEDDQLLGLTLAEVLARHEVEPRWCRTVAEARASLSEERRRFDPGLLVLDVVLPDGTSLELLREVHGRSRLPAVVAISGAATPEHSFELARLGVQCFVPKPVELTVLERACERALVQPVDLRPHLRNLVGKRAMVDVEDEVRATMVSEAVAKGGNVSAAARLLSISRQLLQHIMRDIE